MSNNSTRTSVLQLIDQHLIDFVVDAMRLGDDDGVTEVLKEGGWIDFLESWEDALAEEARE